MEALVLTNQQGLPVTTSLKVAEVFKKDHDKVCRDIRSLECDSEFNAANFGVISYKDSANREQKAYEITKDGFAMLVMGYTGKKAFKFKMDFINEFNRRGVIIESILPAKQLSPAEMMLQQAKFLVEVEKRQLMIEANQDEIKTEQAEIKQKVDEIDARTTTRPDYFTISGFARRKRLQLTLTLAAQLGKRATLVCTEQHILIDTVNDPRFGFVNSYPSVICEQVFKAIFPGYKQ